MIHESPEATLQTLSHQVEMLEDTTYQDDSELINEKLLDVLSELCAYAESSAERRIGQYERERVLVYLRSANEAVKKWVACKRRIFGLL